jgi:hypothetical protein
MDDDRITIPTESLSDEELDRQLTDAAGHAHRSSRFDELFAEWERRREQLEPVAAS